MNELLNGRVIVKAGDITAEHADAIVNAANSSLMGGGGVDGAIHRAGGAAILDACKALRKNRFPDGLPTGRAVSTPAGNLPARFVIHTVGPVWHGGGNGEPELLADCYRNSLRVAEEEGCATVAFPAISTGVYGYPRGKAAKTASRTVRECLEGGSTLEKVIFVFFSEDDADLFMRNQELE